MHIPVRICPSDLYKIRLPGAVVAPGLLVKKNYTRFYLLHKTCVVLPVCFIDPRVNKANRQNRYFSVIVILLSNYLLSKCHMPSKYSCRISKEYFDTFGVRAMITVGGIWNVASSVSNTRFLYAR
jgi:hypothetical protein